MEPKSVLIILIDHQPAGLIEDQRQERLRHDRFRNRGNWLSNGKLPAKKFKQRPARLLPVISTSSIMLVAVGD